MKLVVFFCLTTKIRLNWYVNLDCVGNSTVTTLGDPTKGVYISKYSDCLRPRPWYHGKSGYIVIFNLIKGKVKAVPENYTTSYTSPSFGYDCHVAANINKLSLKTSYFRAFELSQYYLYEFLDNSIVERPRQILPHIIVAFQYSEPNKMSTFAHKNTIEYDDEVLISPWRGQLIIQGQLICDLTLWSPHGAVIPAQLPRQLDAKYVMEVSTLKKKLPESAFRKSNYLEKKVCHQGLCFSMYEVEISNKQGKKLDQLTEYIKTKELAIIKCLEDQGFLILLTSSALLWDTDFGDEHMNLYAMFLFPSSLSTGRKESKCEEDISVRVVPILPTLHYALLEAKKFLSEEEIHPNVLVKHHFQEFAKLNKNSSLSSQNSFGEPDFFPFDTLSSEFKSGHHSEKCTQKTLTRLKSYFSDPSGYALEITTALDLLAGHSPSPFSVSDGICDVDFSLFMPPDPELVDSEAQMKNETEKNKYSEGTGKANENTPQLCPASNLRIQPKRKASMSVVMQNKKVNLCRPFSKKTGPVTTIETTVKLAKGQFPQKRKRGAEVLTAQFIQTTKLDQKSQETSVSASVPVVTNAKKIKKPETSPIKTVPRINQAMKKPPQKQRVNIVKSNQNPRMRKQLQPAKREIPSQPPVKVLSNDQGNDHSENPVQPGSTAVVQSDLQESCIGHFDSQALNMLADLALSSATSTTSSSIHRDLSSSSDVTQNNILFCKENPLQGTYDHEYHRLAKNQRCALYSLELSKPSYEQTDSRTNLPDSQSEKSLTQYNQISVTQEALPKETVESSDESNSKSSFIAIEHSYALLTAEHSKKHLQQRGTQGPTFAKNGIKGPEAGTPVGKVMPFRHQHHTPPVQKLLLDPIIKHKSRLVPSNLKEDFCHSHTVFSCDGSFKVTCKCETEYVFSLDSKYTNNPLEKTVIRALHGPWNADVPDNVEEVKLILHMWVALFYSSQNKVIPSARKVVEHSNPAKYVSINSTLDPLDFNEVSEECLGVKRHSIDSPLESSWTSSSSTTTGILLACTNIKPSTSGLEERATLAREDRQDAPEFQSTICSSNNEVIRKRVEQELPSNKETPNIVLSSNASTQTREPSIADENEDTQKVVNSRAVSQNGINDQTMICGTSVNRALEDRGDSLYEALGSKASTLQNITEHSSSRNKVTESQESLENKDGDLEYVMINLEPITFTFEKNACLPVETGFANGADKITESDRELIKKVSPVESLRQQIPFREIGQAQGASSANQDLKDIPSVAASVSTGTKYLCTSSVARETLGKETGSLQKEVPIPLSTSPSSTVLIEAVSSVVSSGDQATSEEIKLPQDTFLQTPGLYSISSEEVIESSQVEEIVLTPTFAPLESKQTASAGYIPSRASKLNYSLEKETNESGLNSERMNFESVNLAFTKETCISLGREAVSIELSDDSDIELSLTLSPPTSPRDQAQSDEVMQIQAVPLENVELQVVAEEIIEPVNATFPKKRETNSSDYSSLHTAVLQKPLENKECKRDAVDPVTLVLAKESCALEIGQEVNIISNSPFDGALIEPVSPASIPDDQVPSKETPLSQDMPLQMLELHSTISKEVSKATQIQSIDLSSGEEDSASVSHILTGGKSTTTQEKPTKLSAEMALPLVDYTTEQKESHLLLHRRAAEDPVVQNKYDDARFFPGNFQCCDTALNQTTSVATCEDYKTSFQELKRSENPLQQTSEENKSLDLTHTVLDIHKAPLCLRKLIENGSVAEKIHSSAESDLTSNSLDHKSSPLNSRKDLHGQSNKSLNSTSVDQSDFIQMYTPSKNPNICISMDDASHKSSSGQLNEERFQEHGISVVSILNNDEIISPLHEESINSKGTSLGSSLPKGEGKTQVRQEVSVCETKDQSSGIFATKESNLVCSGTCQNVANIAKNTGEDHSALAIQKPSWEASRELVEHESAIQGIETEKDMKSPDRNMDMNLNTEIYYESLSGESDQECFGDVKHSQLQLEDSCPLRTSHPNNVEEAAITNYDTLVTSRTITTSSDIESWNYSHKSPVADEDTQQRSCSAGLKKGDKYVPFYIKIRDLNGTPRTYTNFTVTKKLKDTTRTLHNLKQQPCVTARCGLISSWTSTWQVADDPTQNTLDLEYLRFAHKLKQMVKNGKSQLSTTSSSPLPKESHIQTTVGVFPLTKVTETPVTHPTSRSRSPLLVTIVHSEPRECTSDWPKKGQKHSDINSLSSSRQDKGSQSRTIPNAERDRTTSFHLNKLKYDSKLKESRNDISLILSEYAEFNKVMLNNSQRSYQAEDPGVTSGKATLPKIPSFPRRMASYENMITDLCSNLHVKLKSVIKEACKSTFLFYLVETEDSSFFIRTRSLLRKEGHKEIEPQHFCQALHRETDTLIVIIKNEDISTHVHQIPSLLRLKLFSSVMFAGVDSPGDVLDGTYQELFRTGGFVVSDDRVLEAVTLGQLKEIVKILEKLNANGKWKWLLHYRESKKLKEDVRVDSIAHSKNLVLKSYQSANIIEVLHYHQCDSKSSTKSEYLKCLLNLQVLHINARFAVYLTDKLNTSREIFENSGILVTDINNFAGIIQKAAPFKATYW
ncbi:protein TASOR 2 isoform X1 [Phascolarctos cinereus]|uniref:Protein FAM208B isoform X1 n=1 Tax=Phascolarctos cinereus TaxID=38626 RepID=A0A6P5J565_PHACI|nr:protein FAM208B isoform X1 [Phascolarctos cinereus]XP_020829361.1 protein FAM208B isoform X2 [Phascolarctos cinereus]